MSAANYDMVVVGAGAAGLTAGIGLARAGFAVAVLEAAAFPGAENWSGCVYFCENLAHPDILGEQGVEGLAWERRLVERGFFATDGHGLFGMTYRDPAAFRHCYTVLRPIYDQHLGQIARRHGVGLLNDTTAESLIRDGERVVGVCTQRGPIYADLVFLAEGDASQLVTREGYERYSDPRDAAKFLQGIKQVIDLPPGAVEQMFGVGPEEGVAYEMLVRNGLWRGRRVHLNMGGFVYSNRQSLSVGLVLPLDNLHAHFGGDPNLLMEWFVNLPALSPWLKNGRRGVFGAKIIRGGGAHDIPTLIDHGLAIGGAASAVGVDFPYPNFTGPATAMGLLLVQAARRIRDEGGRFSRDDLLRHYLLPLQQTHYWQDVEFLRRWPGYVKRTQVFFGRNLDLALGSAYIWTRPDRWLPAKWVNWVRLLLHVAGPAHWVELRHDFRHLMRALRLREVADPPTWGRLLLDGSVNALRDLFGSPRANLPEAGQLRVRYTAGGGVEASGLPPRSVRKWFRRFAPVLAAAARRVYSNDDTPLADKLPTVLRLLTRQVNMLDLLMAIWLALATVAWAGVVAGWERLLAFLGVITRGLTPRVLLRGLTRSRRRAGSLYRWYTRTVSQVADMTRVAAPAAAWEARLGQLAYQTVKASHIHLLWPKALAAKNAVADDGLWHVCPAHVYEARTSPLGQVQVIVNFENCIKCETCWRISDLVDWGRDGRHRFIYPVSSPAVPRLLEAVHANGLARASRPKGLNWWEPALLTLRAARPGHPLAALDGQDPGPIADMRRLLTKLEQKLREFDDALAEEPRTVDRSRAEYLEMLARYAQQLAMRFLELLSDRITLGGAANGPDGALQPMLHLAGALVSKAQERARRTWTQRYAWAAADGRQLRWHHLPGLQQMLGYEKAPGTSDRDGSRNPFGPHFRPDPVLPWLAAEQDSAATAAPLAEWCARLDAVFPPGAWRELEKQVPLTPEQDAVLRDLLAQVPVLDGGDLAGTLHPPVRKALLAELGRRDPSLAFRAASHLWARDLAHLAGGPASWSQAVAGLSRGDSWSCFAVIDAVRTTGAGWTGEALFVPATYASNLVLLLADQLLVVSMSRDREGAGIPAGLRLEPLSTLGLRGAGIARLRMDGFVLPETRTGVDHDRMRRVWSILSNADLTSIASGMADQLCRRAIAHATGRVQFPGLFHDEESRDTIGKFGAVKKMVAAMAARRYLIETLDHTLSPVDFSAASLERARLIKAVVAEALGTAPGSVAYNAGQIFGGTGYSEDDILSKFYRDAAAWRFLGTPAADAYRRHGHELLRSWRLDGQRLATIPGEIDLFEDLAQRKALQAELDEVRNARSRLRSLVSEWQSAHPDPAAAGEHAHLPLANAEIAEVLARQDAFLLASKALLLRTHARLERGYPAEIEMALMRVWLEDAAVALDAFEGDVRSWFDLTGRRDDRPVVEPAAGPPISVYADYLAAPCPYDTGDFLVAPVDLAQPRLVPEMIQADPLLARNDRELKELLGGYFGPLRGEGVPYERYIERQHRPDAADLEFCRQQGFFRMPIPTELGGEGRPKVDYYLLTTNAQRLADVAISLTIQANTSIGTTPILLARGKDLPKAQKDVAAFLDERPLHQQIQAALEELVERVADGLRGLTSSARIERSYETVQKALEAGVLRRPVVKSLAHRLVKCWQQASGVRDQGSGVGEAAARALVEKLLAEWKGVLPRSEEMRDELGRRRDACDLHLRWIAAGQISAFALTEPSAGSDTARVATRARLRSVAVEAQPAGVFRFTPAGAREPRYLLDARRLDFSSGSPCYRWSESAEPAAIHFDEYDYETDDPGRMRYFECKGLRIHFTDIAQLREREGRLWYDYWELTGAKMWITNGRMAGVLCLYAKTDEGVTGFVVDRHAEGLIVGKDEAKMGQCGSPTNELSLQAVRVPRENVLGIEGRGQVNALETLNVGRAGLAMSAMAQMEGLIHYSQAFALAAYGELPDWVGWRLQRMEEDRFTAEALAFEVIGRFEHPQTKSVRMESAISKMVVSELLHHIIELAEEIHGLAGQTQLHLVEKRKRDARILNIYEGTNEVQRFSILKDLAEELAGRWSRHTASAPTHIGREALELEALKRGTRQRVDAALKIFGQGLWQNPNLQANCFLLAEAAAWLKAADSTLGRLAWLSRHEFRDQGPAVGDQGATRDPCALSQEPRSLIPTRALGGCFAEVRNRLRRFDEELAHLRRGYYAPQVRAATLLFDQPSDSAVPALISRITRPLRILVVLEPGPPNLPHLQVANGRLLEPYLTLTAGDCAALEAALRMRDQASAKVTIEVAAVGPAGAVPAVQETFRFGVDRARYLVYKEEVFTTVCAATALAKALGQADSFDLVLGGAGKKADEDGLVARLTAAALGLPFAGTAAQVAIQATDAELQLLLAETDSRRTRVRSLPAAAAVSASQPLRPFAIAGYLAGLDKTIEVLRWPKRVPARLASFLPGTAARDEGALEEKPRPLSPEEAARRVLTEIGQSGRPIASSAYDGPVEDVTSAALLDAGRASTGTVLAILGSAGPLQAASHSVIRAADYLAREFHYSPKVLCIVPPGDDVQRRMLAQLLEWTANDIVLLVAPFSENSPEVQARFLAECWPDLAKGPRLIVAESWAEDALISVRGAASPGQPPGLALRVHRLAWEAGKLVLETRRAGGKLTVRRTVDPETDLPCWITLADDAAEMVSRAGSVSDARPRVQRWAPRLERFFGRADIQYLLGELKHAAGLTRLADADFIVDVGFGVGDHDGYEAVIEPLVAVLQKLGVRNLVVGGSRKVTEELHLLPADRQIGQSGVSVNPHVLLAIGVSGAPQHLHYIGPRATILAFNRDPEAPIMTLNQRQARPRVFPIVGDLFETVPALTEALQAEQPREPEPVPAMTHP
jgi:alkylation response protein AidB-like acyl-CoA dehydrogenase/flavin-dependent dehydrogenase/electron transfer flavoprotein alpha subunit/ferredoxin-like protein FixX